MKTSPAPEPNNDKSAGGGNLTKNAAAAESKTTWSPALIAQHKEMMSGVPEGTAPGKGAQPSHDYEAKHAYRKAFEEHVGHFLNGQLKNPAGSVVQHREEALTHAHIAGLKAVQALKKGGIKMRVFAD